jgi:hypothetical protein
MQPQLETMVIKFPIERNLVCRLLEKRTGSIANRASFRRRGKTCGVDRNGRDIYSHGGKIGRIFAVHSRAEIDAEPGAQFLPALRRQDRDEVRHNLNRWRMLTSSRCGVGRFADTRWACRDATTGPRQPADHGLSPARRELMTVLSGGRRPGVARGCGPFHKSHRILGIDLGHSFFCSTGWQTCSMTTP